MRRHTVDTEVLGPSSLQTEYLNAVADAALDGRLDGNALRAVDPAEPSDRSMRSRD